MGLFFSRKKEPEKPKITEQDKAVLVKTCIIVVNQKGGLDSSFGFFS